MNANLACFKYLFIEENTLRNCLNFFLQSLDLPEVFLIEQLHHYYIYIYCIDYERMQFLLPLLQCRLLVSTFAKDKRIFIIDTFLLWPKTLQCFCCIVDRWSIQHELAVIVYITVLHTHTYMIHSIQCELKMEKQCNKLIMCVRR